MLYFLPHFPLIPACYAKAGPRAAPERLPPA